MLSFDDIDALKEIASLAPEIHLLAEESRLKRKAEELRVLRAKLEKQGKKTEA